MAATSSLELTARWWSIISAVHAGVAFFYGGGREPGKLKLKLSYNKTPVDRVSSP